MGLKQELQRMETSQNKPLEYVGKSLDWLSVNDKKITGLIILGNETSNRKVGSDVKKIYTCELLNDDGYYRKIIFSTNEKGQIDENDIFYKIYNFVKKNKNVLESSDNIHAKNLIERIVHNKTDKMKFSKPFKPIERYLMNAYHKPTDKIYVLTHSLKKVDDAVYYDIGVSKFFYESLVKFLVNVIEVDKFDEVELTILSTKINNNTRNYNFLANKISDKIDLSNKELYDFDEIFVPSQYNDQILKEYQNLINSYNILSNQ